MIDHSRSPASVSESSADNVATAVTPSATAKGPVLVITGPAALCPHTGDANHNTAPTNTTTPTTPARRPSPTVPNEVNNRDALTRDPKTVSYRGRFMPLLTMRQRSY